MTRHIRMAIPGALFGYLIDSQGSLVSLLLVMAFCGACSYAFTKAVTS